ncbi:MAG TPA: hypothetical protein VKS79_03845 [Gemmataceae bacterium]|nr:hypothetical protein [Gemmataceae bacterium]
MIAFLRQRTRTQLLGFSVIAVMTLPMYADPPADRSKGDVVEKGTKAVVKNTAGAPGQPAPITPADMTKTVRIERGPASIVRNTGPAPANTTMVPVTADNPTVKAGEVNWHKSFAEACAAAKKSGKPVLLFHMMGQLDKQFC